MRPASSSATPCAVSQAGGAGTWPRARMTRSAGRSCAVAETSKRTPSTAALPSSDCGTCCASSSTPSSRAAPISLGEARKSPRVATATAAPRRRALRAQSMALSPPPSTSTRWPSSGGAVPALTAARKSRASSTPGRSRPGRLAGRERWAPVPRNTASCASSNRLKGSASTVTPSSKRTPIPSRRAMRRASRVLSSLNGGTPVASRPPAVALRS